MEATILTEPQQTPLPPVHAVVQAQKKTRRSLSSRMIIFLLSTTLSVLLFLVVVQFMQIPGILVMIAVAVSNGVSLLLIQKEKRFLWGPLGLIVSALVIMGLSWILVHVFHA